MSISFWRQLLQIGNPLPTAARVRRSVRAKLMRVILVTTVIALCFAGAAMLTHDLSVYRHSWASDLSNDASILALSTAPALAFDDHEVAQKSLEALRSRPRLLTAALYSADGSLYASYSRTGTDIAPVRVPPISGVIVSGERAELAQPVVRSGEVLGTIYLRAQYDVAERVEAYLGIFALVMLLSLGVAYAFSRQLRTVITEPLDAMTVVARQIVDRRDYALRARKTTDDEIGLVIDAFNSMLDEVQSQTRALQQSNLALMEEIKVRQAAEEALAVATARLQSTMAAAEIGSWMWDLRTNHFAADRNLAALYGLDDENDISGDPARHHRYIHEDDLASVKAAEADALVTGVLASTEFRVTLPDGSHRWVARRGKVQLDAEGRAIFFSGLLIDISAQKAAEEALRASERLYRAIGESIDYGVWVCAPDGRIIYTSESFLRLTGLTQKQCSDSGWINLLHPDDTAGTIAAWRECVATGGVWYREQRVLGLDGLYHPILAQGVPIRGEDGRTSGWAGINLDISRLKKTEEALRDADRRKDEFLATLAHELRNPLAPIRHAVRLLESEASDPERQQWAREVIVRQVQRMALLLDDLLDVSRITRGRLALKIGAVRLDSLVGTAVETARPLIDSKNQHLTVRLPQHSVTLSVDALRLSQSLSNLLTNAAKYTDPGGSIALTVSLSSAEIVFSVADTGIGLAPAAIPGLFEMFSQVDSVIDRAEGGLGIGLALVKGLISLHGGSVEAVSAGVGAGSEFIIRLPLHVLVESVSEAPAAAGVARAAAGDRNLILVADDNQDAAQSMAMVLEMGGYEVVVAHSGEEAFQKASDTRPDAAILDIGMPDMTGYELARRLRQEPWGRTMILMAITGWGQQEDKERAKAAGFDRHFTKPVDPDDVEGALHALLDHRQSE
jgi:PAS domain S-box-containing protein